MNTITVLAFIALFAGSQAGNLLAAAPAAIAYAATPFTYKTPGIIAEYPTYQVNSPIVNHVPSSNLAPRVETYATVLKTPVVAAKVYAAPAYAAPAYAAPVYGAPALVKGPFVAPNPTLFL